MKENKSIKRLVDENVTRHDLTRHCEEGERSAARRGNLRRALTCSCKFTAFTQLHPLQIGRGKSSVFPLQAERVRERVCHNNSDNSQSLINRNHFTHSTHLTHFTHLRKRFATQIIRGAAKARFRRTLRAGLANARTAPYRKFGFTLAETLITLGVIGIVAAMTIPTLVNNYKTQVNVVKIKKFYSMFNQAIKLSEVDNGPIDNWFLECGSPSNPTCTVDEVEDWYNNYLGKYIKTLKIEKSTGTYSLDNIKVYLTDGSFFSIRQNVRDVIYYPDSNKLIHFILNGKSGQTYNLGQWENCSSYLDTYCFWWDGTREGLIEGRNYAEGTAKNDAGYCSKLLQYDGWVVKDDNPCTYY